MSVLVETSAGWFVVDLFVKECPKACLNFVKLCKSKYYNNVLVFQVTPDWIQSGDPSGTGQGGRSLWGEPFQDEIHPKLKLNRAGLLCMASDSPNQNGSRFFLTLNGRGVEHLDGTKTVFGEVAEGFETIQGIGNSHCDDEGRPFRDIRITHTFVLVDPFPDPPELLHTIPSSPESDKPFEEEVAERIPFEQNMDEDDGLTEKERMEKAKEKEMKARAIALEMMGDLPDADMAPPENVLFVCKLNPATESEDLELIFSRFGEVKSCEVIRDKETGQSLQYAFVEFSTPEECQEAYFSSHNTVIDDRRIKVDFSQSVAKIWNRFAHGRAMPQLADISHHPTTRMTSRDAPRAYTGHKTRDSRYRERDSVGDRRRDWREPRYSQVHDRGRDERGDGKSRIDRRSRERGRESGEKRLRSSSRDREKESTRRKHGSRRSSSSERSRKRSRRYDSDSSSSERSRKKSRKHRYDSDSSSSEEDRKKSKKHRKKKSKKSKKKKHRH